MNSVTVNLDNLSTDQLDRLADDLFNAVNSRRNKATLRDGIISDAELIARLTGKPVIHESAKAPNKRDGHLYQENNYTIRIDAYGNAQTITYEGREVWNRHQNVFLPSEAWMAWIRATAQALIEQRNRQAEADTRQKLLTSLQDTLRGTEFSSVTEALEHFQLGPFIQPEPKPEGQVEAEPAECLPSADDIRRDILVAGLSSTTDPVIRECTLRLIRKQLPDFHSCDSALCEAVLARLADSQEWDGVRREAVATAWGWLDSYTDKKAVAAAFFAMLGKGGADARLVIEGMALLGKVEAPVSEDYI